MDEPFAAFDLGRMVFGDEPPLFLAEIAVRTVIIYVYTLLLIRWIGSRSIAQLSLVEFLLVIALGSAVGDAMFYPDVPLLHCIIVITMVVLLDKALGYAVSRNPKLEDMIEGKSVEVMRDGLIRHRALKALNFGHDELFEQLRLNEIVQLGQVRAAYLETNGLVSIVKAPAGKAPGGLPIEPPWDVAEPRRLKAGETAAGDGRFGCRQCGLVEQVEKGRPLPRCSNCGGRIWHDMG